VIKPHNNQGEIKMRIYMVILGLALVVGSMFLVSHQTRGDWSYRVRRGDTFYTISRKTGISVISLRRRNGFRTHLRIGQKIIIPSKSGYYAEQRFGVRNHGEFELLARVIYAEAGAEPFLGKVAVGGVILNRVQSSRFPRSIAGVVYQPHAFESVSNGIIYRPATPAALKAARAAIAGWDPSGGALYFFNPGKTWNRWLWARRIINRIGKHVFAI
jgi:N-acetylmuramoyl-L-alanine amidase